MRPWAVVVLALLAGCLGGGPAPPPAPAGEPPACATAATPDAAPGQPSPLPLPVREGFEATADGALPLGWAATDGTWGATASAAAQGSRAMRGEGDAAPGFSLLLAAPGGDLADFAAQVAFRMDCVAHPHGVGLAFHVQDAGNYQMVRYSATESAWDLFTVRDGVREKRQEAAVLPGTDPAPDAWTVLRVTARAGRVEAFDGEARVVAYDLPAGHAASGQVGLFLRGASTAWFDDVRVDGLPAP